MNVIAGMTPWQVQKGPSGTPKFGANTSIDNPYEKLQGWMKRESRWGQPLREQVLQPVFALLRQEIENQQQALREVLTAFAERMRREAGFASSNPRAMPVDWQLPALL